MVRELALSLISEVESVVVVVLDDSLWGRLDALHSTELLLVVHASHLMYLVL